MRVVNKIAIIQVSLMIFICLAMSLRGYIFNEMYREQMNYSFEGADSNASIAGYAFLSYWLIMIRFVPLDLILNLEVGKLLISTFIENDYHMAKADYETEEVLHCKAQSIQLIDELGQVDYIFCDKTGTLTKNELAMRAISVNGKLYDGSEESMLTKLAEETKSDKLEKFFECLSLNHDVITITNK